MTVALAYSIDEACTASATGRTALYDAIKNGELRAIKRGRRTLVLVDDLRAWIAGLPAKEVNSAQRVNLVRPRREPR